MLLQVNYRSWAVDFLYNGQRFLELFANNPEADIIYKIANKEDLFELFHPQETIQPGCFAKKLMYN